MEIKVQTSEQENFTSAVDLISQKLTLTDLIKGKVSSVKFIPEGNLGYMRLYYTVTGTTPTTGAIFAGITDSHQESFHN